MKPKKEITPMRRTLLLWIVAILLPIASGADTFDDGLTHDVDFTLFGNSFVLDSAGGDPTTVNMRSGADATGGVLEVQGNSVLNVFTGAVVNSPDYFFTSSGAVCGGSIQQLLMNGAPVVEVNGGTFITGPAAPLRLVSGTLTVQGGSFENTGSGTVVALELSSGVAEIRGGTLVKGIVRLGGTMQATISGGSYGSNAIQNLLGGTLTIVGTSFDLGFGPVNSGGTYNGPLTGTLADGSAINTTLVKSSGSSVTLVEGTQGPLTSTVCDPVPSVPALSTWAIGLTVMALAATGALLRRRLQRSS
jgi:hypothetical protein